MDTRLAIVVTFALTVVVRVTWAVECVPCDNATCVPPPPGCQLGRRPCSCCEECRAKEGEACGPFTTECESELVCFTASGVYVGRPPVSATVSGRCIRYTDVHRHSIQRQSLFKKLLRDGQ